MERRDNARVWTIPPGVGFLRALAAALTEGRLAPGFRYDPAKPLDLARATIFVPTRRAARELRSEFVDILGGRSAILPVIKPLGETEDDDGYFDTDTPALLDLAPPINGTARLIELGRLILAWRNQLPSIVREIHSDTPLVAPASPADAIWLARALVELIDAVETEERDWSQLKQIQVGNVASWWQLTLDFLEIASAFWPARLAELNRSAPARHRNALLKAEARRIASRTDGDPTAPVIVAGSTGSIPAAAELIAAIAGLENGVVVLPGLDQTMPEEHWHQAGAVLAEGISTDPASRSHPQYGLYRLVERLGVKRHDVLPLEESPADLADRAEVLSRAMAPAAATDGWIAWRDEFGPERIESGFADVGLIEAANEREEATAIAVALRLALEEPGRHGESRVAVLSPDRELAKRVRAELARFGIDADDSAGTPLSATPQGTLLQLLLEAALRPGDPVSVTALLKHPLTRFGLSQEQYRSAAEALELLALRGGVREVHLGTLDELLARSLEAQAESHHAPIWRARLDEDAVTAARDLAIAIRDSVEILHDAAGKQLAIREWAELSGRVLESVAADDTGNLAGLWSNAAGEKLASLLEQIVGTEGALEADGPQWIDLVVAFTAGEAVKPRAMRHPRVFIFGTLEARLQSMDMLVLGGLNEGSWPGQTKNNPFLSRMMKTEIGLEPPEQQIGQLAHDFQMASGTRRLIFTRSMRQGGAPTVASRWLQRLVALGGPQFYDGLKTRGEQYRAYARLLDTGDNQPSSPRPAPKPDAALQPKKYSFSEVGRLRRDPYSIYARRILRLDPLAPFNAEPGPAERGTLYHAIVDRFVRESVSTLGPGSDAAVDRIIAEAFAEEQLPLHIEVIWRHRFRDIARQLMAWETSRADGLVRSLTEVRGGYEIADAGIRLSGVADRIDIKPGGFADIIDYKTGSNPSMAQARSLLDPQLPLEAAALAAGAFGDVGALRPEHLIYVRLRPGERFLSEQVNNELTGKGDNAKSSVDLAQDSIAQLIRFVNLLSTGERGFASRLVPFMQADFSGDYDHLARVAEWSTAEAEEAGDA